MYFMCIPILSIIYEMRISRYRAHFESTLAIGDVSEINVIIFFGYWSDEQVEWTWEYSNYLLDDEVICIEIRIKFENVAYIYLPRPLWIHPVHPVQLVKFLRLYFLT